VRLALAALLLAALPAAAAPSRPSLPDLDQSTPFGISVVARHGRLLLVFGSAVDNVGDAALVVEGRRAAEEMRARQLVGTRSYPLATPLRFVRSQTHRHWHLTDFERYELRRDGALVGRDRKTGFCLNDAYETRALNRTPVGAGDCSRGRPGAKTVREGISPGFGDDYVPAKEGQSIDVTNVRPGRYVLVHRANPERVLRERAYANNAASALIELDGARVRVLARCHDSARCGTK
jgi:Lysyl oxidase